MTERINGLGLDRRAYWCFLRRVYGMGALEAWNYIARMGTPPSVEQVREALHATARSSPA